MSSYMSMQLKLTKEHFKKCVSAGIHFTDKKFSRGEILSHVELQTAQEKLEYWRKQLCHISWFKRTLNKPIARKTNAEDKCTGKFWEARFTPHDLLGEKTLAA